MKQKTQPRQKHVVRPDTVIERQWWVVIGDEVALVSGYCAQPIGHGAQSQWWWCPLINYSLREKQHLFETKREALDALFTELTHKIEAAASYLKALRMRQQHCLAKLSLDNHHKKQG